MTRREKYNYTLAGGILILLLILVSDILTGEAGIGLKECLRLIVSGNDGSAEGNIIWRLRIPRALTAILAGGSMAVAGAQMQSIFRNPLADPHIMGVSSGAGLGAAIAATLWSGSAIIIGDSGVAASPGLGGTATAAGMGFSAAASGLGITAAAFAGAVLTSAIIIFASAKIRGGSTLLILGVLLGFTFSAITSIISYASSEESLKIFYTWSAGSFSTNGLPGLTTMTAALLIGLLISLYNSKGLDVILFGDDFARLSGADNSRIRLLAMLSSCILTGAVTAFCGPIGFVGIVSPHIARRISRTSLNAKVLPLSLLTGGTIGAAADCVSQLFSIPLPVGSTIALIGIPIIMFIIFKGNTNETL